LNSVGSEAPCVNLISRLKLQHIPGSSLCNAHVNSLHPHLHLRFAFLNELYRQLFDPHCQSCQVRLRECFAALQRRYVPERFLFIFVHYFQILRTLFWVSKQTEMMRSTINVRVCLHLAKLKFIEENCIFNAYQIGLCECFQNSCGLLTDLTLTALDKANDSVRSQKYKVSNGFNLPYVSLQL
jgi:hypothetical protein